MVELVAGTLRRARRRTRWSAVGVLAAALVAAVGVLALVRAVMLHDAVLPGVSIAGVHVGGLDRAEARARLERALDANLRQRILVAVGDHGFMTTPSELYRLDAVATEKAAFAAGRESLFSRLASLAGPFAPDREVAPVLEVRPAGRSELAARLNDLTQCAVNAQVTMTGTEPVVTPGRDGALVDVPTFVQELRHIALGGGGSIRAQLEEVAPALTTSEAERAADSARRLVSAPIAIKLRGERLGKLEPEMLARLVRFQPHDGAYRLVLARSAVDEAVAPLIGPETKDPVDARFRIVGKHARVVPSKPGTTLAPVRATRAILAAASERGHARVASVALTALPADLTTREAKALGIERRLSTFTTDMGVSSTNRITNVLLLGRYLDGTIVRPGETFSFNGVVGPRTAERGFVEGQMIVGGVLVPSIGGGVCQVATTVFNAAFEYGLPIVERHNHSYYISHYPLGRDATVSWGGPNLVFRNDLDHAILLKANGTSATFTVSIYGTRQGRKIVAKASQPKNYTQPTLQYAVDPSAPPASVRIVAGGGPGFDVNVHRKVFEHGRLIREADIFTRYTPQNPTAIYGPGKTPPGPYFVLPPTT